MTEIHVVHAILRRVAQPPGGGNEKRDASGTGSNATGENGGPGKTEVLDLRISKMTDPDKFDGILSCLERLIGPLKDCDESSVIQLPSGGFERMKRSSMEERSKSDQATSATVAPSDQQQQQQHHLMQDPLHSGFLLPQQTTTPVSLTLKLPLEQICTKDQDERERKPWPPQLSTLNAHHCMCMCACAHTFMPPTCPGARHTTQNPNGHLALPPVPSSSAISCSAPPPVVGAGHQSVSVCSGPTSSPCTLPPTISVPPPNAQLPPHHLGHLPVHGAVPLPREIPLNRPPPALPRPAQPGPPAMQNNYPSKTPGPNQPARPPTQPPPPVRLPFDFAANRPPPNLLPPGTQQSPRLPNTPMAIAQLPNPASVNFVCAPRFPPNNFSCDRAPNSDQRAPRLYGHPTERGPPHPQRCPGRPGPLGAYRPPVPYRSISPPFESIDYRDSTQDKSDFSIGIYQSSWLHWTTDDTRLRRNGFQKRWPRDDGRRLKYDRPRPLLSDGVTTDFSSESGLLSPKSTLSAESGFVGSSDMGDTENSVSEAREMLKRRYWESDDAPRKKPREMSPTRGDARRRSPSPNGRDRPYERARARHRNPDLIRAQDRSPSPEDDMFSLSPHPVKANEPMIESDILWIRCSPADLYYERKENSILTATPRLLALEDKFDKELVQRANQARADRPPYQPPPRKPNIHIHCHTNCKGGQHDHSSSDTDSSSDEEDSTPNWLDELERKTSHPYALHNDLWFNDPGEMNDGPECRCSRKARESGIRHSIYPGEKALLTCEPESNNTDRLFHYRVTVSPTVNFLSKDPTVIDYDGHEYIFEGFSIFSHTELDMRNIPICKVIRFNIEYSIHFFKEIIPENFTVRSLDLVADFIFRELLELYDLDWFGNGSLPGCRRFHIMPRFARDLPEHGKELLSVSEIMKYLLASARPMVSEQELSSLPTMRQEDWQSIVELVRGMIVTAPGMKPSSLRVDQLDRKPTMDDSTKYPLIVHFGVKPTKLSYAGNPNYQRAWKQYMKYKHLLANKPKVTAMDKEKLRRKEEDLEEIRTKSTMKREVTVEIAAKDFIKTGIRSDICQHALILPVLIAHLRFHRCVTALEGIIDYKFNDRTLIQRALTHPSYRINFGTNPDHARNSLSNCGIRQPEFGDRKIHHINSRKKGINTLINIMSRMGHKHEKMSEIQHYEGLEFLGDAVVEFITSIHLFFMFPEAEEGGLATYRAAIVQNQHLAVMADRLRLQDYMLYAHGPDLCHESHLKHAMANCLEALMGALFLDSNIDVADRVFARTLFEEDEFFETWVDKPLHPLQADEPRGDRHWVKSSSALQKLTEFEEKLGLTFNHVRLLARAFTPRNVGFNSLTLGHNQRLEFLGDTVLQLVVSEYLFKHFPEHHEGHLSLLRSSLVNNRTQSVVCDDLGMTEYIINLEKRDDYDMKMKEKADLLEAFIGSLYVDSGLDFCLVFCEVCFFPRLKRVILNQDWNDPKSQLQQCCLTLRELDGGEPFIPTYKVLESAGPTNTRTFKVAVYFQGERLATGLGQSIQRAEMNAAYNALTTRADAFPQLKHQKRFIEKKYWRYKLTETDIQMSGFKPEDALASTDDKTPDTKGEEPFPREEWRDYRNGGPGCPRFQTRDGRVDGYNRFYRGFRRGRGGFRSRAPMGRRYGADSPPVRVQKDYPRAYRDRSRSKSQSVEPDKTRSADEGSDTRPRDDSQTTK